MTNLPDKTQNALDESRTLILGAQVLVGLQYPAAFEPDFGRLSRASQYLLLLGLGLILFSLGLLISPVSYHRTMKRGADRENLYRFVLKIMKLALLPFALSLGLTVGVACVKILGATPGIAAGLGLSITAISFWYGLGLFRNRLTGNRPAYSGSADTGYTKSSKEERAMAEDNKAQLADRIRHVLTEARMVLPGAQALMGFQFVTMLMREFDKLPRYAQELHLVSLSLTALTTILLMTPAAYHRIVERGEDTEEFHRFASRMVIAAMAPLAAGLSADYYVFALKVTASPAFASISAVLLLTFFCGLWFGVTMHRRRRRLA